MNRLCVIGLDGATFDLIDPWVREGRLPNLKSILDSGAASPLESTVPPTTFPAWTSMVTGTNPAKHGIFDFQGYSPEKNHAFFVNSTYRKRAAIWELLSAKGRQSVVVGMPGSYPSDAIDGVMISGWDMPNFGASMNQDKSMHPSSLVAELESQGLSYEPFPEIISDIRDDNYRRAAQKIVDSLQQREKLLFYLLENKPWELFFMVLPDTDITCHFFWNAHDPRSPFYASGDDPGVGDMVLQVYERVDALLGRLLASLPSDTNLILVSDHGFGGTSRTLIDLNQWLIQKGFLVLKEKDRDHYALSVMEKGKEWAIRLLPGWLKARLLNRHLSLVNKYMSWRLLSSFDWERTRAYSLSQPTLSSIWINLRGREPAGIVTVGEEYERLRDEIIEALMEFRDPEDGLRLVSNVHKREAIYSGPALQDAPDLVIEWALDADGYSPLVNYHSLCSRQGPVVRLTSEECREVARNRSGVVGGHRQHGIFVGKGPSLRRGHRFGSAHIFDLLPTMLYLLGERIPEGLDGRVLVDAIDPEFLDRHPRVQEKPEDRFAREVDVQELTSTEAEDLRRKLKGLGYVD